MMIDIRPIKEGKKKKVNAAQLCPDTTKVEQDANWIFGHCGES